MFIFPAQKQKVTVLYSSGVDLPNLLADASKETLLTYTIPANTLYKVGQYIEIEVWVKFQNVSTAQTANVEFEGTLISAPSASANSVVHLLAHLHFVSAGNQKSNAFSDSTALNSPGMTLSTFTKDETTDLDLTFHAQNFDSAAGDIIYKEIVIKLIDP